jgi:flagellin FlaB
MALNKKGAQGIGTLIIFIAMILVAAVAAGVLIQTASSLQSKALDIGGQSQEKITTDIEVMQIFASGTNDTTITANTDNITLVVRLGPGSDPVKLEDMIIKFDTASNSQTLSNGNTSATEYGVNYLINGTSHVEGYVVNGDMVEFILQSSADINEGESATVRLIAKNGAVKPIDITTPSAMVEANTFLYP